MEEITAGMKVDVAYGRTPEEALLGVLGLQPAFSRHGAEYLGERPPFMDVVADWRFIEHDWEQYEEQESTYVPMGDGIQYNRRLRYDAPMTPDQRWQITLSNVWVQVQRGDGRANVKFKFSITLRESELEGDNELRDGDHHWRCERMSTEPIDE